MIFTAQAYVKGEMKDEVDCPLSGGRDLLYMIAAILPLRKRGMSALFSVLPPLMSIQVFVFVFRFFFTQLKNKSPRHTISSS